MLKVIIGAAAGAVLGVVGARLLFVGSALSLIPWGLVALGLGLWSSSPRQAVIVGASYGFVLAFVFMVAGYGGEAPLVSRLAPFALLGCVGAVCGIILGLLGRLVGAALRRSQRPN